ncbi:MAG: DNA repair protein RecO [Ignavibacteriaceae bacterium]|jgi:DNA repair protein RecO (recombination protein O)|nr:DNA repair protein RecO [Ignavibacteriaceae bacterium]
MSEIVKTEAIVLSKMNYGDSSSIASMFTEDLGKITVIVKGARSPKSKYGKIVDPLNYLAVVLYKKESREIQLLSQADIVEHYPNIKNDLSKLGYAYGVVELVKNLLADHEVNKKIFKGIVKILSRLNSGEEKSEITFGRFFMFLLKETGYEIQIDSCALCGKQKFDGDVFYNFEKGLICGECKKTVVDNYDINLELFRYLNCLKTNESAETFSNLIVRKAIVFMENHLKYHVPDFKGISSLKLFN